jgi:chaperonin GroES
MRVLGNRVLVKRLEDKTLSSKIIEVVTLGHQEPGVFALVAGVGPGTRLPSGKYIPIEVKTGDVVILKKYSGAPITLKAADGTSEDFHLVDAEDVLAVQVP